MLLIAFLFNNDKKLNFKMLSFNHLIRAAFSLFMDIFEAPFFFYCFFTQTVTFKSKTHVPELTQGRPISHLH